MTPTYANDWERQAVGELSKSTISIAMLRTSQIFLPIVSEAVEDLIEVTWLSIPLFQ
jgi:hypothetical protein